MVLFLLANDQRKDSSPQSGLLHLQLLQLPTQSIFQVPDESQGLSSLADSESTLFKLQYCKTVRSSQFQFLSPAHKLENVIKGKSGECWAHTAVLFFSLRFWSCKPQACWQVSDPFKQIFCNILSSVSSCSWQKCQ